MDSCVWESHSFGMEKTSEIGKEGICAEYHSDSDNSGTSVKRWGDKELRSSTSYTDASVDSAYTSSNKLSYLSSCPARSFTDSGKEYSLDTHPSETSCDELPDSEDADNTFKPSFISTPKVSSIKDQRSYFQRNYTIFKEHLEPSGKLMDEMISFECRDKYFPERIREAPTRQRRVDILIKYAAQYLDQDKFESLLKKTDHAHLIKKLKKGSAHEACRSRASEAERRSHLLCDEQFKDLLMDEIEPRNIIDRLVDHEVLRFEDHEDILVTDFRPTRVENLMKYISRNPERNFIYFFNLLKEYYPHLIDQFDACDNAVGCESTSEFDIIQRTGSWRVPQSFSIDKSAKIKFHVKLSPPNSDVEMRVVEESETNMEMEYNMKLLDLQQESMQLGSIVIVHRQLTDHVIGKLQEACSTREIKRYIKSLFTAKDVEQMRRDGVAILVLKITAEKSQQVHQKLLTPVKITHEAMCLKETYLDSVIQGVHGSFIDTAMMITGRELHENASFLLDELEPKEYVQAFDSILPRDVLSRLINDVDRRERAKLLLDEIVEKGQQAVEIFVSELQRLGRHHVLNVLRGSCTNTSGIHVDRIAYQIRTSIVNNYNAFVDELEPNTFGTFFVERRVMDNALYEKMCQLPSRRNRAVAFLKWLLDEERPDAYIAFQKAMKIFSSDTFVRMLETTESLNTSGISSPAADQTKDAAPPCVLLYTATFRITFSNDTVSSKQGQKREAMPERVTDDKSDDRDLMSVAFNSSENETDTQDSVCKYQETKGSGLSVDIDLQSFLSAEEQTESLVARGSDLSKCGSSVSSWSIKPRHIHIWPDNTIYIPCERISSMLKVTEWLLKQDTADIDVCSTPSADNHFILSNPGSDATSSAFRQSRKEMMKAATDDVTPDERNHTSSETCMPIRMSNLKLTEEDEKLVTNDNIHKMKLSKRERDNKLPLFYANTWHSTKIGQSYLKKRKALYRLEQRMKRSTTDCFSLPEELNTSYMDSHDLNMTEKGEKVVTNDVRPVCLSTQGLYVLSDYKHKMKLLKREQDSEPSLFNCKTLHSIQSSKSTSKEKVAQSLPEQSKNSFTTDCFSHPLKRNTSYIDRKEHLLYHQIESTAAELEEKPDLLTKGTSTFCHYNSKIEKDCYNCFARKTRMQCRYGRTNQILKQHKKQGSQGPEFQGQRRVEFPVNEPFLHGMRCHNACQSLKVEEFMPGTLRNWLGTPELHK